MVAASARRLGGGRADIGAPPAPNTVPVLHVAAECAPFAKTGGLADVVGALPQALAVPTAVVIPFYGGPDGRLAARAGQLDEVHTGMVWLDGYHPFRVWRSDAIGGDVPLYLVDEPVHFGDDGVYFRAADGAWFERGEVRFLAFQLMVLDWLRSRHTPFGTGGPDGLHLHDHHAGLIPVLLRHDGSNAAIRDVPTVLTVHSADHHGEMGWPVWDALGVAVPDRAALDHLGVVNSLKAGVGHAGAVTTVSPTYARELTASPEPSHGLDYAFRLAGDRLTGIVNGIDADAWDPAADPHLPAPFSADNVGGKSETKRAVCADLGLDPARPLAVFVGRLTPEKGAEVLAPGLAQILAETEAAVAVLGSGYAEHESALREIASGAPDGRMSLTLAFDEALAHRLYGAADLFLMPSKQEPCGLGQLYAMRYGAPPVVHGVGGLCDTVAPWDGAEGTGFRFGAFTADAFADATRDALAALADGDARARLQQHGMRRDSSWAASARAYGDLYRSVGIR